LGCAGIEQVAGDDVFAGEVSSDLLQVLLYRPKSRVRHVRNMPDGGRKSSGAQATDQRRDGEAESPEAPAEGESAEGLASSASGDDTLAADGGQRTDETVFAALDNSGDAIEDS